MEEREREGEKLILKLRQRQKLILKIRKRAPAWLSRLSA